MSRFWFHCIAYPLVLAIGLEGGFLPTYLYFTHCPVARKCPRDCPLAPLTASDIKRCSVRVECQGGGHGSGTLGWYDGELYVLTAEHCASLGDRVTIGLECSGGDCRARLGAVCVAASLKYDLALLRLDVRPSGVFPPLLPVGQIEVGEDAHYCGWGGYCPLYYERTVVQNEDVRLWPKKGHRNFMIGGNGQAGNSGSGVWVNRGGKFQLAGVIVAGWSIGQPMICVHPESIGDFLMTMPREGGRLRFEITVMPDEVCPDDD